MIKPVSLTLATTELEHAFKEWSIPKQVYQYKITLIMLGFHCISLIIMANNSNNLATLISASLALSVQATIFFFVSKYTHQMETLININMVVQSVMCEVTRIFVQEDQWQFGFQYSLIRLALYMQGTTFLNQTFIYIGCFAVTFINNEKLDPYVIFNYSLTLVASIIVRYFLCKNKREYYLAAKSQQQYENILENLLPAWVVLVKYNKFQAQLVMDKVNRDFSEQMQLDSDKAFRDFLRKLIIMPDDKQSTQRTSIGGIKLEHALIRLLQQNQGENEEIKEYFAILEGGRKKSFKISQVYFNTIEPIVLLLFEPLTEDKLESLKQQIVWRDHHFTNQQKINLKVISSQIGFIKYLFTQILPALQSKPQIQYTVKINLQQQLLKAYILFNQSLNMLTSIKINYNQLNFSLNEITLFELIENDQQYAQINYRQFRNIQLCTDKSKLVSIIISIIEFIRILIAKQNKDDIQFNALQPLDQPINIKFKPSKTNIGCYQISLSHNKFTIPQQLEECINGGAPGPNHKTCNWGTSLSFENLRVMSEKISAIIENDLPGQFFHLNLNDESIRKFPQQFSMEDSQERQTIYQKKIVGQQDDYNYLGLPLAQYLISQIGPHNTFIFKHQDSIQQNELSTFNRQTNKQSIKFLIYQDLNKFITQINQYKPNPIFDLLIPPHPTVTQHKTPYRPNTKKLSSFYPSSQLSPSKQSKIKIQ